MEARDFTGGIAPEAGTAVDFSVIIVSHNTLEHLRECLRTLASERARAAFRVIVVDNASHDGSPAMVLREFPDVVLHENRENVGYSRAVNQAARESDGRYFLVLNPDILVRPGSLGELVRFMDENPRVGVAGGKLLNPDGTLQYSCRSFYTFRTLLYRRTFLGRLFPRSRVIRDHLLADWDHATSREVDWVLGACMIVRRDAVREVGLMDERFFLYFEDVDWCYRMKRRGWSVFYVPSAVMVHHHRRESARGFTDPRFLNHLLSVFHFYDKWNGALLAMKRYRGTVRVLLLLASDLLAVNLAFLTAYLLRLALGAILVKPLFPIATYTFFLAFVNVATLFSFFAFGLYGRRSSSSPGEEVVRVARAVFASFLILMAGTFLAQANLYSRSMVYAFWPIAGVYAIAGRLALRGMHGRLRSLQFDLRRVLVLGQGPGFRAVETALQERPELGYEVVASLPIAPANLGSIVREEQIEEVVLAGTSFEPEAMSRLILECREIGVVVTVVSGATELVAAGGRQVELGELEALSFQGSVLRAPARALTRARDVVGAVAGLVLVLPVASLLALRARERARRRGTVVAGPLVARMPAMGREGRKFELRFLAVPDPRTGELPARPCDVPFRWSSPALVNVLRGDMSVVGPRPRGIREGTPRGEWAAFQLRERPGLTGLWRVRGARPGAPPPDELDRRYLRNRSPGLDLQILIDTLLGQGS